jgi:hypothetical protein
MRKKDTRPWHKGDPEKARIYNTVYRKEYRKKHPESFETRRERHLREDYGITFEQKQEMLSRQGNVCLICRLPLVAESTYAHVDHNHETKEIRGILCNRCNIMIGFAQEDSVRLRLAADYLEMFHGAGKKEN